MKQSLNPVTGTLNLVNEFATELKVASAGVLGRSSAGLVQVLTVGSGLTLAGTTLSASGGGGGSPAGGAGEIQVNDGEGNLGVYGIFISNESGKTITTAAASGTGQTDSISIYPGHGTSGAIGGTLTLCGGTTDGLITGDVYIQGVTYPNSDSSSSSVGSVLWTASNNVVSFTYNILIDDSSSPPTISGKTNNGITTAGGDLKIIAGSSDDADGGDLTLQAGSGSGTPGEVNIIGGGGGMEGGDINIGSVGNAGHVNIHHNNYLAIPSWTTTGVVVNNSSGLLSTEQGAAVSDASGGGTQDAEARTAINGLLAELRILGIIAT